MTTNTPGLLSKQGDVADWIQTGVDVDGEIAGEEAFGGVLREGEGDILAFHASEVVYHTRPFLSGIGVKMLLCESRKYCHKRRLALRVWNVNH